MATRADAALLARKRNEKTIAAVRAPRARETFFEIAAAQKSPPAEAEGEPVEVVLSWVTPNFFEVLGVEPPVALPQRGERSSATSSRAGWQMNLQMLLA